MARLLVTFFILGIAGCASRPAVPAAPRGDGGAGTNFGPFTPATRGAAYVDDGSGYLDNLELMMTNAAGGIGCSLTDPSANPGRAVSRVLFTILDRAGERAPTCGPATQAIGRQATAVFEQWDANGRKTEQVEAVGGAVSFAASPAGSNLTRCDVEVDLTFPGGAPFSDKFSFTYPTDYGLSQACVAGQ